MPKSIKTQGFTLIEVMVAVVILAIGLLGMATLMTQSMQSSESAYSRSQASVLAYDMIDRMRSNKVPSDKLGQVYKVSQATRPLSGYTLESPASCPTATCTDCTDLSRAVSDLAQWCLALNTSLPNVLQTTTIKRTPSTNLYTVDVRWQEPTGDIGSVIVEAEL